MTVKENSKWKNGEYAEVIFGDCVPLYHPKGTQLLGSQYKIGDPVFIKETNSIGFVINGAVTGKELGIWADEVRTDAEGVRCVIALEPLTAQHLQIPGINNYYSDVPEVMEFFKSLTPTEPKLIIVRFPEKENWDESIQEKFTQIWGYYLVDLSQPFHQCSIQLDVQGYFLYNRFDWPEDQDFPYDEDEQCQMEWNDGDSSRPTFALRTNWGQSMVVDCSDFDNGGHEGSWEEFVEGQIENIRCNPIEFEFCKNKLITL